MEEENQQLLAMEVAHPSFAQSVANLHVTLNELVGRIGIKKCAQTILDGCIPGTQEGNQHPELSNAVLAEILDAVNSGIQQRTMFNINKLKEMSAIARGRIWCVGPLGSFAGIAIAVFLLVHSSIITRDETGLSKTTANLLLAVCFIGAVGAIVGTLMAASASSKPASVFVSTVVGSVPRDVDIYLYQKINRLVDALINEVPPRLVTNASLQRGAVASP